jgi:hypothetical protein
METLFGKLALTHVRILEEIPYLNVPLHTLLVIKSYGYDFEIETVPLKGKTSNIVTHLRLIIGALDYVIIINTARSSAHNDSMTELRQI